MHHRDGGPDPTELLDSAQQVFHRPTGACHTSGNHPSQPVMCGTRGGEPTQWLRLAVHRAMDCVRVITVVVDQVDFLLDRVKDSEYIETQGPDNKHGDDGYQCDHDPVLHHRGSTIATEASRKVPQVGEN